MVAAVAFVGLRGGANVADRAPAQVAGVRVVELAGNNPATTYSWNLDIYGERWCTAVVGRGGVSTYCHDNR